MSGDVGRTEVSPGYLPLARALRATLVDDFGVGRPRRGRVVVGVGGESGSGKSVTAASLARELSAGGVPAGVLHQDDYFVRPPRANHEHRCRDLRSVGPQEVRLDLMAAHVAAFRAGLDGVEGPSVDYANDRFVTRRLDFGPLAALIVEGTYALTLDDVDVRVFLAATHEETRERRRVRNRDVDAPIIADILAIEHAIIAPQAARADVLIDRDFALVGRRRGAP